MSHSIATLLFWLFAYLIGAIPFGYLVGRLKGKNLFLEGSKNIGATNAGRVLGRPYGILVFILDFLKGALPTAFATKSIQALSGVSDHAFGVAELDRVGAAAFSFLGHLFPIYLGFRGGKGVATGAGAALMVALIPAIIAVIAWITVVLSSRMVSLASIVAAIVIMAMRFGMMGTNGLAGSLFLLIGGLFIIVKHRTNISRIIAGTENRILPKPALLFGWHLLFLGFWFGGSAFFNFVAAPTIFESFETVVANQPSDRTAGVTILPADASPETKKSLGSALAGSAVGPIFPKFFVLMTLCAIVAVATSFSLPTNRKHHVFLILGLLLLLINLPISGQVSQMRFDRFSSNIAIAEAAKANFVVMHLISLLLSGVTTLLSAIGLFLAGMVPHNAVSNTDR